MNRTALAAVVAGATVASASTVEVTFAQAKMDAIAGEPAVEQEQTTTSVEAGRVLSAIDKTVQNTSSVRKLSAVQKVDIVFLADAVRIKGGPPPGIRRRLKDHEADIAVLRQEVEANALLFHAIDSRRVMPKDILAVDFPDPQTVIVYTATEPQAQ